MKLHEGYFVVEHFPEIQFYSEGKLVDHIVKKEDRLHIKVEFNRNIPGNITSYITTSEKYTCIVKGDVIDNHDNKIIKGFSFK